MAVVEKTVLVPFSAAQMFALVDGVEQYPQFLPWCDAASVSTLPDGKTHATLHINYHHVKHSFTTENTRTVSERIEMTLKDGPFRQLDGAWHFMPLSDSACKIQLRLRYEFSGKLLEKVIGPVFHFIANNLVDAFIRRAEQIYE
jgi:ribosome-associated toxin RatA of RatAB toxin-antitoxin module